ncbi:23S rRNA (adenine(1618)-N(6))-methyltransferase RlmF [Mucilaginibacter ginsenosidivorax]|uniref:Ribosomal RNA large subunit methyltransferase F n=1 Tax=Mucilaginibacter ginsenosidivorax TaxID=862126 RepID=A0A5B8W5S6_9SPHI|nr:23S rRNA (adenine(1618)-N(6))-methyltransferase RlmF [Mucilaginibacter ginsenosidivorax]QEC78296.1 23S rRNA (adenine(1618)-N(6))-methyltransferase RlmF [Mucilaginibacter ginsenosidivorax]
MPQPTPDKPEVKETMHPRNAHRMGYDFNALIKAMPKLRAFVTVNKYENETINFSDPEAVKLLNRALLKHHYRVEYWDIPEGYLCPPIPGRADYIHYAADLLATTNDGVVRKGKKVRVLDIGVGANCVYPIIGHQEYGWSFMGVDIDEEALASAQKIIDQSKELKAAIELRLQKHKADIFTFAVKPGELFDLTLCNPPFHASIREAAEGSKRKWNNLGLKTGREEPVLNFGGQNMELWYPGGEAAFLKQMATQSTRVAKQCLWFTTLVSKKENLRILYNALQKAGAVEVQTINMSQGQKASRIMAWTYFTPEEQKEWVK